VNFADNQCMETTELRPLAPEARQAERGYQPVQLSRELLSDEQLARAVSQGDRVAFGTLYERYRAPLSRYCRSILRHPDDSADAFQSAMTAAFTALEREPPTGPLKPWLYRIAHNESIDLIRRRKRASEDLVADAPEPPANSATDVSEQLQTLLADLGLLPERQRGALLMRELAGLEYDQIGRAFTTSSVAARKLVYEARVTLGSMRDGREASCELITRQISDGDGRTLRNRVVRSHLDSCASCATFERSLRSRREQLALVPALPVAGMGIWLATSISGGAGATKAIAGSGAVAGGAVAGTSALGAGAGGGMVSSLSGAMAVKCLAVCGALAVAGAGAAIATHTPSHSPAHRTPLTSAAAPERSAQVTASSRLQAGAGTPANGRHRAVTGRVAGHPTRSINGTHGRPASGGLHLRVKPVLTGTRATAVSSGATASTGHGRSGPATASPSVTATSPAVTPTPTRSKTSTTASVTSTTSSSTAGGSGTGSPPTVSAASGPGSNAASSGASSSRTSATPGTSVASAVANVVESSVAKATSATGASTGTVSGLVSSVLGGGATTASTAPSAPANSAVPSAPPSSASSAGSSTSTPGSTGTSTAAPGSSTSSSSSPLSGLLGLLSGS
jgi:RNA polymerase sigma factor (sigma-70 family)